VYWEDGINSGIGTPWWTPSWQLEQQLGWVVGQVAWGSHASVADTLELHSMGQLLLQGGMWGRQELAEGTWAEMHMALDAGVSEGVQAAVGGSQVAVRHMPAETYVDFAEWGVWLIEEALLWKTGVELTHEAM